MQKEAQNEFLKLLEGNIGNVLIIGGMRVLGIVSGV